MAFRTLKILKITAKVTAALARWELLDKKPGCTFQEYSLERVRKDIEDLTEEEQEIMKPLIDGLDYEFEFKTEGG